MIGDIGKCLTDIQRELIELLFDAVCLLIDAGNAAAKLVLSGTKLVLPLFKPVKARMWSYSFGNPRSRRPAYMRSRWRSVIRPTSARYTRPACST